MDRFGSGNVLKCQLSKTILAPALQRSPGWSGTGMFTEKTWSCYNNGIPWSKSFKSVGEVGKSLESRLLLKSAGMAGLNMSLAFDADRPPTMEWGNVSDERNKSRSQGRQGPKRIRRQTKVVVVVPCGQCGDARVFKVEFQNLTQLAASGMHARD